MLLLVPLGQGSGTSRNQMCILALGYLCGTTVLFTVRGRIYLTWVCVCEGPIYVQGSASSSLELEADL